MVRENEKMIEKVRKPIQQKIMKKRDKVSSINNIKNKKSCQTTSV